MIKGNMDNQNEKGSAIWDVNANINWQNKIDILKSIIKSIINELI